VTPERAAVLREVAAQALDRDAQRLGGLAAAQARYASRYVPGETLYLDAVAPESIADVVIENTDPDQPRLLRI
jgi:uridine kinase